MGIQQEASKKGKHLCLSLMMKLFFFLILSLSFSILLLNEVCGPEECKIECEDDQKCTQDLEVQCILAPCCPQWSCGPAGAASPAGQCPDERPELGTSCDQELEGVTCDYGSQECCGQLYPEMTLECVDGQWQGYYIDTLCVLGLAPPCPNDTTTTIEQERNVLKD